MHERYEEMCALATIGELPEAEFTELQEHLMVCDSCQQLYREFCQISANYLGSFAADSLSKPCRGDNDLDPEDLLSKCLARAGLKERAHSSNPILPQTRSAKEVLAALLNFDRGRKLAYFVASFAMICAAGFAGFEISRYHLQAEVSELRNRLLHIAAPNETPGRAIFPPSGTTDEMAPTSAKLSEELKDVSTRYARLSKEKREIEEKLASATTRLHELDAEVQTYQHQHQEETAARAGLQARLSDAQDRLDSEEQNVTELYQKREGAEGKKEGGSPVRGTQESDRIASPASAEITVCS